MALSPLGVLDLSIVTDLLIQTVTYTWHASPLWASPRPDSFLFPTIAGATPDKAFLRRLRFFLNLFPPGPAERKTLWQRALPQRSPAGDMTGADISAAALGAALLARSEQRRIHMSHVLQAARREMAKHGVVVRPGEWEA